jgi:hypothetical protein
MNHLQKPPLQRTKIRWERYDFCGWTFVPTHSTPAALAEDGNIANAADNKEIIFIWAV